MVLLSLAAGFLINYFMNRSMVRKHIDLGNQYLNSGNYDGVIAEYTNVLTYNPADSNARLTLSDAYVKTGDTKSAIAVIEEAVNADAPDATMVDKLIELEISEGEYLQALQNVDRMIRYNDDQKYYDKRRELLGLLFTGCTPFASGTDVDAIIEGGKLMTRGSNALGQLGTSQQLGTAPSSDITAQLGSMKFSDAGFSGTADRVSVAGRTVFVIDSENKLYAAGENRFGQKAAGYGALYSENGWMEIPTPDGSGVGMVSGTLGNLYLLTLDGVLYHCGGGDAQSLQLSRVMDSILTLQSTGMATYAVTSAGRLLSLMNFNNNYNTGYDTGYSENIRAVASNVKAFAITPDGNAIAVLQDGSLSGFQNLYYSQLPTTWKTLDNGNIQPDVTIKAIAADDSSIYYLDTNGSLYMFDYTSGQAIPTEVQKDVQFKTLYQTERYIVAVGKDQSVYIFNGGLKDGEKITG